jgi:hypothetical protein
MFPRLSCKPTFQKKLKAPFLSKFANKTPEDLDFPMNNVQKMVVFCIFYEKYSTHQKRFSEVLSTNYKGYSKILVEFKIKRRKR